jgi:hypothetical protein
VAGDNNALAGAIRIWKLALADVSRADNSADWARTQNNLGVALETLGARESGTARLEAAVAAYDGALEIFLVSHAGYYEEICRSNRARASTLIEDRRRADTTTSHGRLVRRARGASIG